MAIAVAFLGRGDSLGDDLIGPVLFLVVVGLFAGGLLVAAAAHSITDPVERVRAALERGDAGSLGEEVVVDDGGEIGFLLAGFNRMVAGLRERERIREAFGTYLDREVAEHSLREGTALQGEEVEVTIMFVDIRGFTGRAERLSAPQVVATLNRLFERIVPTIHAHGGHVDKYVGDGLLVVFGGTAASRGRAWPRASRYPRPSRRSSRISSRSAWGLTPAASSPATSAAPDGSSSRLSVTP